MKIGYKKIKIDSSLPIQLAGFARKEKAVGKYNDIEINTLVGEVQGRKFIICIIDSIILEELFVNQLHDQITTTYKINRDETIIACTHTHSAPAFFKPYFEDTVIESELQLNLFNKILESIFCAFENMHTTELTVSRNNIKELYGNRNRIDGAADKEFNLIKFCYNSQELLLGNIACHPTIHNGSTNLVSSDFIGDLRSLFEAELCDQAFIANGCCGDVSNRFYRNGQVTNNPMYFAKQIFSQLNFAFDQIVNVDTFKCCSHRYTSKYDASLDPFVIQQIGALKCDDSEYADALLPPLIKKFKNSPIELNLESHILEIGDLLIITLPGDICAEFSNQIKSAFPSKLVIIIAYAGGYSNYFVPSEDYGQYFESYISRIAKNTAEIFISDIIKKARELISE